MVTTPCPGSWVLEDMQLHQSVGSVNLDLTQAIVPDQVVLTSPAMLVRPASTSLLGPLKQNAASAWVILQSWTKMNLEEIAISKPRLQIMTKPPEK